jgi:hypothetical protein
MAKKTRTNVVVARSPHLYISVDGILVLTQYPRQSDNLVAAFGESEITVLLENVIGYTATEDLEETLLYRECFLQKGEPLTAAVLQKILAFVKEWRIGRRTNQYDFSERTPRYLLTKAHNDN